jgi:hypothetical protein
MNRYERRALAALRFDWAPAPDDVWQPSPFHVDGLHDDVLEHIADGFEAARRSQLSSPIGVAILGQRGSGKTHMLGKVRENVQDGEGYFFLVDLLDGDAFWPSVVQSLLEGLLRETHGRQRQLTGLLRRLSSLAGVPASLQGSVTGDLPLSPDALDDFVGMLRRLDRQVGLECHDTARALVLYGSVDHRTQDIGYHWLLSMEEAESGDRSGWGIRRTPKAPRMVVRDLSRLLALTGPSVIAVDQIDTLIAQSVKSPTDPGSPEGDALLLEQIAGGLMGLREIARRTLPVVACLPESWILIKERAVDTAPDRFREALHLRRIPDARVGRAIIQKRFGVRFGEVGFDPPYPTWPVRDSAFADAVEFTPRGLLKCVDAHVQSCLSDDKVTELDRLVAGTVEDLSPPPPPAGDLVALDARFARLRATANVAAALDPRTEDEVMPALLSAGLAAWIAEQGEAGHLYGQDPPPSARPALHARLRRSLDERTEDERHWAFRAVASGNARAVQSRIRGACTMAGLSRSVTKRRLFLLRNSPWPAGPVTAEVVAAFTAAGGVTVPVGVEDLRTFAALRQMLSERDRDLQGWLVTRRPAGRSQLLQAALDPASTDPTRARSPRAGDLAPARPDRDGPAGPAATTGGPARGAPARHAARAAGAGPDPNHRPSVEIGTAADTSDPVRLPLESLRKHIAIFAGSGSGKTVLIRRLVEECALLGVSAIVLDPNNDLARLGEGWPEPPVQWGPGDPDRARDYLAGTDVVVWTPRRASGRPLSFQPLPDFRSVVDDADETGLAIDAAVAALAPRAKVDGRLVRSALGQAVLRESLDHFARRGGGDLRSFVRLLSALPSGISTLDDADRIASGLAQTLTAAMVNDPLFGGAGEPVDPGLLLTPPAGRRARVSVVSMVGLPTDEQRQGFVNQLQMSLFAWIKRHPAGDRPLGGLFVMDEAQTFAPSGAMTACTQSTLALASQARKYGLGLVFATQAPKGLHNRIPGNAATQFFGFLNSPTQIDAANDMARAKGGPALDISRLATGQFYLTGEGLPFRKVLTPLCLTHHPASPLTPEEVVSRARRG